MAETPQKTGVALFIHTTDENSVQLPVGATNPIPVSGTLTATGTKAEDAAAVSGDSGIPVLGVRRDADTSPVDTDGDYQNPVFDATGNLKVVLKGQAAHDAAIAGNPVRTGARAVTANPTAVATGDTVDHLATLVGAGIVKPFSIPEADWTYTSPAAIADTNPVEAKAAPAAGLRNYVTGVQLSNTDATVPTLVQILSAVTVLWQGYVGAQIAGTAGNQVVQVVFHTPLRGAVVEAINVKCVTTSAEVYANLQGYVAP